MISLVQHGLPDVLELLRSPAGALLFMPLYALWVTLLLPGVWASMLAGVLYGTWLGSGLVFVGACLGAVVVFLLGRSVLRDWARRRLEQLPKLQAVERAVSKEGLKLVLLTRLSPAFPFSLLNLAYGLSEVSLRDYNLGLIGIIPGTILFCALGALAGGCGAFRRGAERRDEPRRLGLAGGGGSGHCRRGVAGRPSRPAGFGGWIGSAGVLIGIG